MSELDPKVLSPASEHEDAAADSLAEAVSVRVSPHSYLTAILIGTFFSAFCFYIEFDDAGYGLFVLSWVVLPFLALRDRIRFDGRSLIRTGMIPRIWAVVTGSRKRLKITDIEQAETHAVRALKRGGNVYYRYRTVLKGKGLTITIASGGEDFRRMIGSILPLLPPASLDIRSAELRDHLKDPKETLMKAEFARIPGADVLIPQLRDRRPRRDRLGTAGSADDARVPELQELANELRVIGHLAQSLEAFRRALKISSIDGRLLFEFARCLHSFGAVERDPRLTLRSLAALRLAEGRSRPDVLSKIGEFYLELGEWRRAGRLFQRVRDNFGGDLRAARGAAEMALHEGKIAHVVHHFADANRMADNASLRRWAKREADYFAHLNADDEYMEMEVSRVNLLDGLERSKRTALRIASIAFPAVIVGLVFEDDLITKGGWAISTVALIVWVGLLIGSRFFSRRIPYELMQSEDQ